MKRFISVLSSLLVLPAFAEVAPVYYDDVVEYTDDMMGAGNIVAEDAQSETTAQKNVAQRTTINRSTATSRAISSAPAASSRMNTSSRAVASSPRTATAGTTRATTARSTKTPTVASRSGTNASRTTVTSRNTQNAKPVSARVGVRNNVMSGSRESGNPVVLTDSSQSLYNSTSRIGVANRRASSRLSTVVAPVTTSATTITQEEVSSTTNNLAAIAELTDYCKAQYAACMDNYCNVLDDNQGRCSCSRNIKNYAKAESTLAQATEDFQDVVQQIRYIGLTTDQIESLFNETEAELSMKSNSDKSRLKNSLDAIKGKIKDVSSPSASSYTSNSGISLDMNGLLTADFTAGFDLNSFLSMSNSSNTDSVSNQRGEALYKTASSRCKTAVLNSCTAQGIEANIITNAYDLEIDKQCVLYERSLNDANAEMKSNATNAATILQQARLLLAQNRNSYDFRGCVAALDACMQDEYVCGSDYELCLDPTGKYISDGELVKGGTPGVSGGQVKQNPTACGAENADVYGNSSCLDTYVSGGMFNLYSTWNYGGVSVSGASTSTGNAWSIGPNENLGAYVDYYLDQWKTEYKNSKTKTQSDYLAMYLLQKIGYIDSNDKVHGMCASVFKQCQDYTFDTASKRKSKSYIPNNEVIRQYLNSTLAKIKVQQDEIISDYAEGCKADVQSCLSTNGYEESNTSSTASKTALNSCAAEITTCMSVGGYQIKEGATLTLRAMSDWVSSMLMTCPENQRLIDDGNGNVTCGTCESAYVIVDTNNTSINSLDKPYTIPASSNYYITDLNRPSSVQLVSAGGRVTECSCPEGYVDYYTKGEGIDTGVGSGIAEHTHVCLDDTVRCVYTEDPKCR